MAVPAKLRLTVTIEALTALRVAVTVEFALASEIVRGIGQFPKLS